APLTHHRGGRSARTRPRPRPRSRGRGGALTTREMPVPVRQSSRDASLRPAAPLSVLHVLASAEFGGMEAIVQALAIGSRGSRVEMRVAAVIPEDGVDHPL